ncbi:MAG: nuclear transport factor 2 family protein, partial [Prolixibacteraceae bacterium]|nr:nuclear transport factor 2 family protein [Prolixibacteraceae bacterium]
LVKFNGYWKVFNVVWDYYGCTSGDSAKLVTVLEKYLEYWNAGADEQMAELIHPNYAGGIALSHKEANRDDKSQFLSFISKSSNYNLENNINFTILDIYLNTASVKITVFNFVEYLHLSYQNDTWYIVNALRNFDFRDNFTPENTHTD